MSLLSLLCIADLAFEYSHCAICYGTHKKLDVLLPGYVRFLSRDFDFQRCKLSKLLGVGVGLSFVIHVKVITGMRCLMSLWGEYGELP